MTPKEHEKINEVNEQWREMQRDAERYRFLKEIAPDTLASICWRYDSAIVFGWDEVDKVADAAMAEHLQKQRAA